MKKIFTLFIILFPLWSSAFSAQELALDQFRQKLKGIYYDPRNDGMKGFRCEVTSAMVDKIFTVKGDLLTQLSTVPLKPTFDLVCDQKELKLYPEHFQLPKGFKSNENLEALIEMMNAMRSLIDMEIQGWAAIGFPWRSQDRGQYPARLRAKGEDYELFLKDGKDQCFVMFGPDFKIKAVKVKLKNKPEIVVHTEYEKLPKGYALHSCDWKYQKYSYNATAKYGMKDDYFVPEEIKVTFTDGKSQGVSIFDILQFKRYGIDW